MGVICMYRTRKKTEPPRCKKCGILEHHGRKFLQTGKGEFVRGIIWCEICWPPICEWMEEQMNKRDE